MYYISREEAAAMDPGERLYAIRKEDETYTIVADIEENLNLYGDEDGYDDTCRYRVELYGWYGEDWTLDRELLLSPGESAIGERRGEVPGDICFAYETTEDWSQYDNAYECLFDQLPDAEEDVVVIDSLSELVLLPSGLWLVICEDENVVF